MADGNKWPPTWFIIIIILIVLVPVIIFFIILIIWLVSDDDDNNNDSSGGLFSACNDIVTCMDDLVCDNGTCKRPLGSPCTNLVECASPANICNMTCKVGQTGGLNQFCPCDPGLVPVTTNNRCICKGGPDFPCSNDNDCQSGECDDGFCTSARGPGESCVTGQCSDGNYCSNGFCQSIGPPPVITGNTGAACFPGSPYPPALGQETAGCSPGNTCIGNTCVAINKNLGSKCTDVCNNPLICSNGICTFQNNPNECLDGGCITGFVCQDDLCRGRNEQSCTNDDSCLNGCSQIPKIMTWKVNSSFNRSGWKPVASPGNILRIEDNEWALTDGGFFRKVMNNWVKVLEKDFIFESDTYEIIDFGLDNSDPRIVGQTAGISAVFSLRLTRDGSGMLVPFNTTDNNRPGVQFDLQNNPLFIKFIDFSKTSDVVVEANNSIYIKKSTSTKYEFERMGKKPRFYTGRSKFSKGYRNSENYAYVSTYMSMGIMASKVSFSGQLEGLELPQELKSGLNRLYDIVDYNIYSNMGIRTGSIYIVARILSGGSGYVAFVIRKNQLQLAGYFNETARVSVNKTELYISTSLTCSS